MARPLAAGSSGQACAAAGFVAMRRHTGYKAPEWLFLPIAGHPQMLGGKHRQRLLKGHRGLDQTFMPLFSIKTPAAGIFGKTRNQVDAAHAARGEAVPGVEEFEADFVSYLTRLDASVGSRPALGHERKELSHG
jgi:hypothetical protein